jgi:ribosomal protein L29
MPPKKTTKTTKTTPTTKTVPVLASDIKMLRSDLYVLKMKLAMHELKETHQIRKARKDLARHLTQLHNA